MGHKTLVDGTSYEVVGGRTLINGTGYDITGGKTLVNGTGYDISFTRPLSSLAVGSSVFTSFNGAMTEFIVIQQGIPSGTNLYSDSCNGTWLQFKDKARDPFNNDDYYGNLYRSIEPEWGWPLGFTDTDLYSCVFFRSNFLSNAGFSSLYQHFDTISSLLTQVAVPMGEQLDSSSEWVINHTNAAYFFLLSQQEIDGTYSKIGEGNQVEYYKQIGGWDKASQSWTRSVCSAGIYYADVGVGDPSDNDVGYVYPCFILPFSTKVDSNGIILT